MNCDVIVTYCWNRVGYNIIRSLYNHGLSVVVGDTSKTNICSLSRYSADNFIYANPFTNENAFIKDINEAIKQFHPRIIMPTHDEAFVLARHIKELPSDVIFAMPSYDMMMKLSDKLSATCLAQEAKVPTPNIIENLDDIKYPIVVKLKMSNSAKGVFIPKNKEEALKIISNYSPSEYLIESYFQGQDYSVDCVRWDNFFKCACYRALVTKTNGGGTTTQRVIVKQPALEKYAKMLLDYVDYHGVCGIDFKVNEQTGKVAFIEVNTRFTGGLATPMAAGFDIPYIMYTLYTKGRWTQQIKVKVGTKTKWILGDIIALVTKIVNRTLKKEELKRICDFNYDAFDDFRKDDKKAIWGECSYYLLKLIKNRKLNP